MFKWLIEKERKYRIAKYSEIFLKLFLSFILIGMLSCNSQHYDEHDGKWVIREFPQYTFSPLDSTWEPHPAPTKNCAIFLGKKKTGTHIGVFLHSIPPGGPSELMKFYLNSDATNNRVIIQPSTEFREGILAICRNRFKALGAEVQAIEATIIIPTNTHLLAFTFKRKIQVDTWDFRRETGEKVFENLQNAIPEFKEFLIFCQEFEEIRIDPLFEEFTSTDFKFSVLMPGKPQASSTSIADVKYNYFKSENGKITYVVSVDEYLSYFVENNSVDNLLENLFGGMHPRFPKLLKTSPIEYKGYPGKQFVGSCFSNSECMGNAYLIGNKFYATFVIYKYGESTEAINAINQFLDSFNYQP